MKIHILFGHRKESYDGEHAPEALEVADEYTNEENPDWILCKAADAEKSQEWQTVKIVELEISQSALMSALYPKPKPILATIV